MNKVTNKDLFRCFGRHPRSEKLEPSARKLGEFKVGDRVRFVPAHALGSALHSSCQDGRVAALSSKSNVVYVVLDGDNFSRGFAPSQLKKEGV